MYFTHAVQISLTRRGGDGVGNTRVYKLEVDRDWSIDFRGNVTEAEFISSLPMQRMHEVCQAKSHFGFIRAGTTFCLTLLK